MNPLELHLLNDFQRDFPLCAEPFAAIAARVGTTPAEVLATLRRFQANGTLSRVGPVFRPHSIGLSTLAALAVPAHELEVTATWINAFPEINHNYEREHHFNLWFVATTLDDNRLTMLLDAIRRQTGYPLLVLPMLEPYHIDLSFDLIHGHRDHAPRSATQQPPVRLQLTEQERCLVAVLQTGLPLVARPYEAVAAQSGLTADGVIASLRGWLEMGVIRRFGVVVRHRELGFTANAMTVWDVPDNLVAKQGRRLAVQPGVNLCYHRPRRLPDWPYNLFCMFHGRDRAEVLARIAAVGTACDMDTFPQAILFSRRRFKQRGAVYVTMAQAA